jgi:hypothetical protein
MTLLGPAQSGQGGVYNLWNVVLTAEIEGSTGGSRRDADCLRCAGPVD